MADTLTTFEPIPIAPAKLRRIALDAQGLLKQAAFGRGRNATRRAVEQLGYVQIDTISVVARAHDHVLHSRVPNYHPDHVAKLLRDGSIFEYWYHAAAYLPMSDYRFALPRMQGMAAGTERWVRSRDKALMADIARRIEAEGPLKSRDFENPEDRSAGWWNWKPAKRALEQLFMQGELMIIARDGFQKTYDLTERVLPEGTDTRLPDDEEMATYLLDTMLKSHGFVTLKAVTHLRRGREIRQALKDVVNERQAARQLTAIRLPGGHTAYADPDRLETRAPSALPRATLLSPFDNLVIHRDRVQSVFGFDFQIECYLNEADRRFGYFCLPLVYRDILVGRADCKAHRNEGLFEIKHLHVEIEESDKRLDDEFLSATSEAITRFATFNNCDRIELKKTSPSAWQPPLARLLAN
jgi:uncharacterized protein YcaQ